MIEPIAPLLPQDPLAKVIFVPYDTLFLVPFAALQDQSGKYLIEKHTLMIVPSIQVLNLMQQRQEQIRQQHKQPSHPEIDVLVVGNPTMPALAIEGQPPKTLTALPGTEKEARAIAQLLKTQPLIGREATKTTVVQRMSRARLIHLATHGLLNDLSDIGLPGALALAASDGDNGFLTSNEILQLQLQAELVVLSACDTGRGSITGDGVIGLSRALLAAGVPNVIVSLWQVPDQSTAFLMTQFYQNLQQDQDRVQALRQAMLKTLESYPDPKNWAAFIFMGTS